MQIGLQSSQVDVLKNVNRSLNTKQFSEKINLLNKYGAVFGLDLIYGLPGDTLDGFLDSLDYALYQIPNHLDVFRLSIFPGTVLFERAEHFNLKFKKEVPYSVISSPEYSEQELSESETIADAVDIFYNKGKSAPWFLSVVDVLNIRPAKFFSEFSTFLINNPALKNPYNLQYKFLVYIFDKNNKTEYLSIALDICKFHNIYSEALYSNVELNNRKNNGAFSLNERFIRNPNLKTEVFSYDINLIAEQGMINIKNFVKNYSSEESYAIIFNNGFEVETISIEKYLYNVIEKFTGEYSIDEIIKLLNIEFDEIEEFISFLFEMKLIAPVNPVKC